MSFLAGQGGAGRGAAGMAGHGRAKLGLAGPGAARHGWAGPGTAWRSVAWRGTARQGKVFDVMNDFITRRQLNELVELERRRERRARIRCAVIVLLSLVFWLGVMLYVWSAQ